MKMPDISKAQIAAFVTFALSTAATLGLKFSGDLGPHLTEVLVAVYGLVAVAWKFSDAHIRHGRAQVAVAKIHANAANPAAAYVNPVATGTASTGYAIGLKPVTKKKPATKK